VINGDVELESEAVEAAVPPNHGVSVGEACSAVVGVPDASGLDEARIQKHINIHGFASSEEPDDLLLYDELKSLGSDSLGEAADDGSGVASLLPPYQAKHSDALVDVEDPCELSEAAYSLVPHYEEGSEDAEWVSRRSSWSLGVVAADELLLGNV